MKRVLILALVLAMLPLTISFAATSGGGQSMTAPTMATGKDMIAIYGHGNSKCSEFLDFMARGQETVSKNYQVWINGFISAYNTLISTNGNVARGKRSEEIMVWMTRYCQQNPSAYFQRATIELLRSLEAGEF